MVHVPDDILMAFVDGELSPSENAWLEGELAADPLLRRRLEPFAVTRAALPRIFNATLDEPLPERLVATVRDFGAAPGPGVLKAGADHASRKRSGPSRSSAQGSSGLRDLLDRFLPAGGSFQPAFGYLGVLLFGIGMGLAGNGILGALMDRDDVLTTRGGVMVATGVLEDALDRLPAGGIAGLPGSQGTIRPVATFRDRTGRICRQYLKEGETGAAVAGFSGLACRDEAGAWRIALHSDLLDQGGQPEDGLATQVGIEAPRALVGAALDSAVKGLMGDPPISPSEEDYFIRKGWDSPAQSPREP